MEAPGRVRPQPGWVWCEGRWLDPATGELVDVILDREPAASDAALLRTLEISPGLLRVRSFRLPNGGTADPLAASILAAFEAKDGEVVTAEQLELALDDLEAAGVVREFSERSRRRLRERVASCDWATAVREVTEATGQAARLHFVMLSYPGNWRRWAPTPEACIEHLERLAKRLERLYGIKIPTVWKREFQRRGAPHNG